MAPLIIILNKRLELVDVIAPLCQMFYNSLHWCQRTAQTCCPPTMQIVGYIYRLCDPPFFSLLHLFVSLSLPLACCNNDVRLCLSLSLKLSSSQLFQMTALRAIRFSVPHTHHIRHSNYEWETRLERMFQKRSQYSIVLNKTPSAAAADNKQVAARMDGDVSFTVNALFITETIFHS